MPRPSPYPSTYPSDEEWWNRRQRENVENKGLLTNKPRPQWTTGSVLCCLTILILMVISPTVVIAAVVARVGLKLEEQATPIANRAMPMINDAENIVRTASMTTRLFHQMLNSSIQQTSRLPHTVDITIETLNESKRLINRLANMAEHPPAVTLNVGG